MPFVMLFLGCICLDSLQNPIDYWAASGFIWDMEKTIAIRYKTAMDLGHTQLHDFQGDLKVLTDENYEKLKKEIINTGFAFAPHAWQNPSDQNWYLVDGHQRIATLKRLADEGWAIPSIPIVPVEAGSYEEAKRRVLQGVSQYGQMTEGGLKSFLIDSKISIPDVKVSFDFPTIDIPSFISEHFRENGDGDTVSNKDKYNNSAENLENFLGSDVRRITIFMDGKSYDEAVAKLTKICEVQGLADFRAALLYLLGKYDSEPAPVPPANA